MKQSYCKFVLLALIVLLALPLPALAKQAWPETTHDGLKLVKNTELAAVYMNPDAKIEAYNAVMILDCFVAFEKHWLMDQQESGGMMVTRQDMDRIKTRLAKEFTQVFTTELTAAGYKVVDKAASDVLLLRPAIINLNVEAPNSMAAGMNATFSASSGSMTLYMELYDADTSSIIARVIDPEAGGDSGFMRWQNSVTNFQAADNVLKKWAGILVKFLDKVNKKDVAK